MILTEISWQDIIDGKKVPDSPTRKAFREAVEIVAEKGRNALPALNGRIDKAVQIVLNGDISIDSNGEGTIASQSNGNGVYAVGKGDCCSCKDHPKAIKGLCKHILAFHIYTRARALAREKLEALDSPAAKAAEPVEPVVEVPVEPVTPVVPIAEPLVESAQTVSQVHTSGLKQQRVAHHCL